MFNGITPLNHEMSWLPLNLLASRGWRCGGASLAEPPG
jgi:hypothetical protein